MEHSLIYERKQSLRNNAIKDIQDNKNGASLRQKVLASTNADGISDKDLINHRNEMRIRKIFKRIGFFILPVSLYFGKFSGHIIFYSLIPSYFLSTQIYKLNIFNEPSAFSFNYAEKSFERHMNNIFIPNGGNVTFTGGRWTMKYKSLSRDFITANEYR